MNTMVSSTPETTYPTRDYQSPPHPSIEKHVDIINPRFARFIDIAKEEACKSTCSHRLGCVITRGNVLYSKGYNQERTTFMGKIDCCMHAEMAAVNQFMNCHVRRKPKLMHEIRHFTVWCVRIPREGDAYEKGHLYHCAPCNICLTRLRSYGFGRVIFCDQHGQLRVWKLQNYHSQFINTGYSFAQKHHISLNLIRI